MSVHLSVVCFFAPTALAAEQGNTPTVPLTAAGPARPDEEVAFGASGRASEQAGQTKTERKSHLGQRETEILKL